MFPNSSDMTHLCIYMIHESTKVLLWKSHLSLSSGAEWICPSTQWWVCINPVIVFLGLPLSILILTPTVNRFLSISVNESYGCEVWCHIQVNRMCQCGQNVLHMLCATFEWVNCLSTVTLSPANKADHFILTAEITGLPLNIVPHTDVKTDGLCTFFQVR